MKTRKLVYFVIMLLSLTSVSFASKAELSAEAIQQRIKPVGEVNVAKKPKKLEQKWQAKTQSTKINAKVIYETNCLVCHGSGAAGAPKLDDNTAWQPRIKKGMTTLVNNVINGFKMMPPKGGCMKCTDAEVKAAVNYMVNYDRKKATKNKL